MTLDLVVKSIVGIDHEYYVVSFKCMCGFTIEVILQQLKDTDGLIDINNIRITTDKITQHITEAHGELYAYTILEQIIYDLLKALVKTTSK